MQKPALLQCRLSPRGLAFMAWRFAQFWLTYMMLTVYTPPTFYAGHMMAIIKNKYPAMTHMTIRAGRRCWCI